MSLSISIVFIFIIIFFWMLNYKAFYSKKIKDFHSYKVYDEDKSIENKYLAKKYNDKNESIKWARKLLSSDNWVILDTETTGIDQNAQIIQISIITHNGKVIIDTLIKPINLKTMPIQAKQKHGYNVADLENAPNFLDVWKNIEKIINGKTIICYNAEFDKRMIVQSLRINNIRSINNLNLLSFECAMLKYSSYFGEWIESKQDYKWQKLPNATHNAVGDCLATLDLIKKMAEK